MSTSDDVYRAELGRRFDGGESPKFLHFWGHTPKVPGRIDKSCFSQWYSAPFREEATIFPTAEHYMMYRKARLFGDVVVAQKILQDDRPAVAKKLGREVDHFDETEWAKQRFELVVAGNTLKFSQNPALRECLLNTGARVLVEASPTDRVWGIGLGASDERANDPRRWNGLNLLGFALMHVRAAFNAAL